MEHPEIVLDSHLPEQKKREKKRKKKSRYVPKNVQLFRTRGTVQVARVAEYRHHLDSSRGSAINIRQVSLS